MRIARVRSVVTRLERTAIASHSADRALHHLLSRTLLLHAPELTGVSSPSLDLQETIAWAEGRYEDAERLAAQRRDRRAQTDEDALERVRVLLS